jgi:hypothetical protein
MIGYQAKKKKAAVNLPAANVKIRDCFPQV